MEALAQVTDIKSIFMDSPVFSPGAVVELCTISQETDEQQYCVCLETDLGCVSLEGMNQFLITVTASNKASGQKEFLQAALEINLRQEMNSVTFAGGTPYYFTITDKSLDLEHPEVDSSIHEVVDLGLMEYRVQSGFKPGNEKTNGVSILSDKHSCNLIKASVSALLAQATDSHKQVISDAGRLFASRQDYVRDMYNSLLSHADKLSASISSKALSCDQDVLGL